MLLKNCLPNSIRQIEGEVLYKFRWLLAIALGFSNTGFAERNINSDDWFQIDTIIFEYVQPDTSEKSDHLAKRSYPKDIITIEENLKPAVEDSGIKAKDQNIPMEQEYSTPYENITFELESESARRFNIDVIGEVIKKSSANQSENSLRETLNVSEDGFREKIIKELVFQLKPSADGQLAFKDLSSLSEFKGIKEKIERSEEMRVLDNKSWIQPVGSDQTSVMIQGAAQQGGKHEIEGFITFYRKRYLHVVTNLWYTRFSKKNEAERNFSSELTQEYESKVPDRQNSNSFYFETFVMKQNRRVRANELHYLDHPLFGLVLKITKFEKDAQKN